MYRLTILLMAAVINGAVVAPLLADGGYDRGNSRLAPFTDLIEDENYPEAIIKLEKAIAESPDDADLLTLLAFSHRKSGHLDVAQGYYDRALKIDPEHRGANEYLGELYLQMDRLDLALERLEVLDEDCFFGCNEYDKLKQAIEEYRAQNPS